MAPNEPLDSPAQGTHGPSSIKPDSQSLSSSADYSPQQHHGQPDDESDANDPVMLERPASHKSGKSYKSGKSSRSLKDETSRKHRRSYDGEREGCATNGATKTVTKTMSRNSARTTSSSRTVPRSKRRGLLAHVCLLPEYRDARNYSVRTKYLVVVIIAIAAIIGPMGTSIILPAIDDVTVVLNTDIATVNVSVGIYLLALGVFPLWWSSISERKGRRTVYLVSFALFFCFAIGSSLSPNIGSLVAFRFLMGASLASVQSVGAGTISDLFAMSERGAAMGYFYLGPLIGPLLAPIIGGAVAIKWGFRGTSWFLVIFAGCLLVLLVFCLPETLRHEDSNTQAIADILNKLSEGNRNQLNQHDVEAAVEKKTSNGLTNKNSNINGNSGVCNDDDDDLTSLASSTDDQPNEDQANRIEQTLSRITTSLSTEQHVAEEQRHHENTIYDPNAPVLSRISTVNRQQASQLETAELQRVRTELQKELTRLQSTDKGGTTQENNASKGWPHYRHILYLYLVKPTKSVVFLRYPPVLIMIIYSGVSFMCVYFVNMTLSYEYARLPYNFSTMLVGLTYIPNSVCYMLASISSGRWIDRLVKRFEEQHGFMAPEARVSWNCYASAVALPCALIIIGWCFDFHTHWVTPLVGTAIWGFGSMLVIGATVTYIVDSLPGKGATGVALNNLIRQILATIACFVVEPLIRALGVGVLYSILAGVILVFGVCFWVVRRYSTQWRDKYDLQKLYAIVDA